MATIYILLICSLVSTRVIAELENQIDDQQILNELFQENNGRSLMMGFDAKKYLDSLIDLYSKEPDKVIGSASTKELVFELGELSKEKPCFDKAAYSKFDELLESQANHKNIIEYLHYYKNIQLWRCKEIFTKTYVGFLELIPNHLKYELSQLKDNVWFANRDGLNKVPPFYSQEKLALGIYEYLLYKSPEISKAEEEERVVCREEFLNIYKSKIEDLCKSIMSQKSILREGEIQDDISGNLKDFSQFLVEQVTNNEMFMEALDEYTKEWIVEANICIDLMDTNKNLAEKVWKIIRRKKSKSKSRSILKNFCFSS